MTAYYRTLQNASDAAIDMAISAGEAQVNLEQIPKTSKAAVFGMKALSFALNMAAQAAIMLVVNGLIQLSQVSDNSKLLYNVFIHIIHAFIVRYAFFPQNHYLSQYFQGL